MDLLSLTRSTTPSPAANIDPMDTTVSSADNAPLSPPASPTFPLRDAKVSNYKKPTKTPRFPRHPCPTANYTLSLLRSQHEAQRLFGESFTLRNPITGELLGPFAVLSYTDGWIDRYCKYIHHIVSSSVFTLRERELIVLAVASVTLAEYVIYAHRRIAASVGLKGEVVEGALAGYSWMEMMDLSAREKNVYRLAAEMAGDWGRVSDDTWQAVVVKDKPKAKGQEGWLEGEHKVWDGIDVEAETTETDMERLTRGDVATLAQVLASTIFVSVLVNCADLDMPQSEAEVVQQP